MIVHITTVFFMLDFPRNNWRLFFEKEKKKPYFSTLLEKLEFEYKYHKCYPPQTLIFDAFNYCDPEDLKVVILGQDPYHSLGQANGLAFSVNDGVKFPPSLRNILKELESDLNVRPRLTGNLEDWAKQGVFLLNNVLTVREGQPDSHKDLGWDQFTLNVIEYLNEINPFLVFILWGSKATSKEEIISERHHIIKSAHPSPLSAYRGFFGSKPFSKTNEILLQKRGTIIHW